MHFKYLLQNFWPYAQRTKHPGVKVIQVCLNKGPCTFPRGDMITNFNQPTCIIIALFKFISRNVSQVSDLAHEPLV